MTGGRHLLLSLAASALALVLGVVVGAGPVAEEEAAGSAAENRVLGSRIERLGAQVAGLQVAAARDAKALAALVRPLTADRLAGRSVLVVTTPGARDRDVSAVAAALEDAGATLSATLRLQETYVDPAKAQSPLEDLSLRLVPPEVEFPDGALPIERVGTVLARATVQAPADGDASDPADARTDRDAAEVIAGLDELDAVRLDGTPGRRAELAVMVSGPGDAAEARPALVGLLDALDAGSLGAVLTGPGTTRTGLLGDVRREDRPATDGPSTVDSAGTPLGSVATVLALAEQLTGRSGDYGLAPSARRVVPVVTGD